MIYSQRFFSVTFTICARILKLQILCITMLVLGLGQAASAQQTQGPFTETGSGGGANGDTAYNNAWITLD